MGSFDRSSSEGENRRLLLNPARAEGVDKGHLVGADARDTATGKRLPCKEGGRERDGQRQRQRDTERNKGRKRERELGVGSEK